MIVFDIFSRPRSVSELRAKAKDEEESKPDPVKTESKAAKRFQFPKRTVFGFSNNKQIKVELDSSTTSAVRTNHLKLDHVKHIFSKTPSAIL